MTEKTQAEQVAEAIAAIKAEEKRQEEEEAKKITGLTVLAAIAGGLIPIVGIGLGLYNLVKGRTSKGFLYLVLAIGMWIVSVMVLGSGATYY